MEHKYRGGVRRDNRNPEEKALRKQHVASGLLNWADTPTIPGFTPPQRNQRGAPDSSSCVEQAKQSCIYANLGIVTSAKPGFQHRIGSPSAVGMYLYDASDLAVSVGTTLESILPSQLMSDVQLDEPYTVPTLIVAVGEGVDVDIDADLIADAILFAKAVSVTFASNEDEWDAPNFTPVSIPGSTITFEHCLCLYGFFMNNGVKTFIADDSDGQWSSPTGLRYITEAFLLARATGCDYNPSFVNNMIVPPVAPSVPEKQPVIVQPVKRNYNSALTYLLDLCHYFYYKFTGQIEPTT